MIILISLISILASCSHADLEKFQINLDESPEIRWNAVAITKKTEILNLVNIIEKSINPLMINNIATRILKSKTFDDEIILEMKGISNLLKIKFNTFILGNFLNEFYAMCSSLMFRNSDGQVVLGRNFDYMFTETLRSLTIDVEFIRSGKLLYRAVTFAGYLGVATGMRSGAFAITLNQRDLLDSYVFWELLGIYSGSKASSFAIRHVFETYDNYSEAVEYLKPFHLFLGS